MRRDCWVNCWYRIYTSFRHSIYTNLSSSRLTLTPAQQPGRASRNGNRHWGSSAGVQIRVAMKGQSQGSIGSTSIDVGVALNNAFRNAFSLQMGRRQWPLRACLRKRNIKGDKCCSGRYAFSVRCCGWRRGGWTPWNVGKR